MSEPISILTELKIKFGDGIIVYQQETKNTFPTLWIDANQVISVLNFLKNEAHPPYKMLYDLTAIDEQARVFRENQPPSRFTVVYQLLSFVRNEFIRLKVALNEEKPIVQTLTSLWT